MIVQWQWSHPHWSKTYRLVHVNFRNPKHSVLKLCLCSHGKLNVRVSSPQQSAEGRIIRKVMNFWNAGIFILLPFFFALNYYSLIGPFYISVTNIFLFIFVPCPFLPQTKKVLEVLSYSFTSLSYSFFCLSICNTLFLVILIYFLTLEIDTN